MSKILLILVALLAISCGQASTRQPAEKSKAGALQKEPLMKFENTSADFGEVSQGEKVVLFYTFENAGSRDLLVYEAIPSCGCASAKYESSPLKPGDKRTVEVTFDSEGWSGVQRKSITFKTNGIPDHTTITLEGNVN